MFRTVLVANRGEIAVRIIRTLRELGLRSVAVYSDEDLGARHVHEADLAVRIGPAAARSSYLNGDNVIAAALTVGAEAIHPGYGFLAENAGFARSCATAALTFVGPPVHAIEAMGDKIRAKKAMVAAGVPVVPGRSEVGMSDAELALAAEEIGYPVLVKPSAGGGGKGMRLVHLPADLQDALASARREAMASFGEETLFVERFVPRPRHIEIQVLADTHGQVVHLGERECSLQRRHQKVVEEAPSPMLNAETRAAMGESAVAAARAVGYTGAGTVEFIVSGHAPDEFFFMEMNTRLQVEHPVTELITGLDLVEWQLRIAAGEPLGLGQSDVRHTGHAVEARIYAEDPSHGFLPTGGRLLAVREFVGPGVRVDSGIETGTVIGSSYDPMLAKIISHAPDRESALARLEQALSATVVLGVGTNISFLRALITHPEVIAGELHTTLIEENLDQLVTTVVSDEVVAAAALAAAAGREPARAWDQQSGWRIGEHGWQTWRLHVSDRAAVVKLRGGELCVDDGPPVQASATAFGGDFLVSLGGIMRSYVAARDGDTLWLGRAGATWRVTSPTGPDPVRGSLGSVGGQLVSPMPGTVVAVMVALGDMVASGQALVVVEAMKMEHTVVAPRAGVVRALAVREGQSVTINQALVEVGP